MFGVVKLGELIVCLRKTIALDVVHVLIEFPTSNSQLTC